jgi:hypothetical protein
VTYAAAEIGSVSGWWCWPQGTSAGAAILYLHGGAYIVGSAHAYRHFVGQIVIKHRRLTLPEQNQPRGCDADRRRDPAPIGPVAEVVGIGLA